jgi:L-lactate utilization protein LutC
VPDLPEVDLVETFSARLESLDGVVHRGVDPVETIVELSGRYEATEYLSWAAEHLPVPDLHGRLAGRGLTRVGDEVPSDPVGRFAHQSGYLDSRLGITGAEAGFAESGTIVVRSGPGRSRMASLIPDIHIALLPAASIARSLTHWAQAHAASLETAANVVFITGPSRTGDIETILTLGVHGPRHVHVILV